MGADVFLWLLLSSMLFQVPSFPYGRILIIDPLVAWAVLPVVIDHPAGLQEGIHHNRTEILEPVPLQFPGDPVGQTIGYRNLSLIMSVVQDCSAPAE